MKWLTTGQISAGLMFLCLVIFQNWLFLAGFLSSIFLISLETWIVAQAPKSVGADVQKQISDLKDQVGHLTLALSFKG